jgi:DNA replication protein DnaC
MSEALRETDERLQAMAGRLKLTMLRDQLPALLGTVLKAKMTTREALVYLFEKEIGQREENRIRLATMGAHFPRMRTLEQYDFDAQPNLDRGVIRELGKVEWIKTGENAVFFGPPGTGKTHLAVALGVKAIQNGYSVRFFTAEMLLKVLKQAKKDNVLESRLRELHKYRLLIIDELGYLPADPETSHLLYSLVSMRYESRSILVTSNRPPSQWELSLGDPTMVSAVLDRLLHHCTSVVIQGDSYRMKESAARMVKETGNT